MVFRADDIKWVKNIRRNEGREWAYTSDDDALEFQLGFSATQKPGASRIQPGEIVLLFQRVDKVPGVVTHTYLTHLVTPLDDLLTYNPDNADFPHERRVAVIARAVPSTAIYTTPSILSFYKPQWGKVNDIGRLHDERTKEEIVAIVWSLFQPYFTQEIRVFEEVLHTTLLPEEDDFSASEGEQKEKFRKHLIRERNRKVVTRAKERALRLGDGRILCECCNFDFTAFYGTLGDGFIECHHKQPISIGGVRETSLDDLAMVCANCHRMLHKRLNENEYHSVKSLREFLSSRHPSRQLIYLLQEDQAH